MFSLCQEKCTRKKLKTDARNCIKWHLILLQTNIYQALLDKNQVNNSFLFGGFELQLYRATAIDFNVAIW